MIKQPRSNPEENPELTIIKVSGLNLEEITKIVAFINNSGFNVRGKPWGTKDETTGIHRFYIHITNPRLLSVVADGLAEIPEFTEKSIHAQKTTEKPKL